MDDRYLEQVAELFEGARELEADERELWLAQACGSDAALRDEVLALLSEHDAESSGLEPGHDAAVLRRWLDATLSEDAEARPPPFEIPGFRILRRLGGGAQGTVFEAEQLRPRRMVALKVLRVGLGGAELARRFEREAETLARLNHPGIAVIHESGVAETGHGALPWFALELVRGLTLVEHADQSGLTREARLELLAAVCDAVAHAHAEGVVHRDLKPGNVLVDESGRPRVLDFGVARLLDIDPDSSTLQTRTGQVIGTLQYMSPEQASGRPEDVDRRADVFALGVIAFELLTGQLPRDLDGRPFPEAVRLLAEGSTSALGDVDRSLRGDLDTIVAKAMAGEKARRYGDAGELALELRRFVRREPIQARPASALYHLGRFVHRHRALSTALAALVLALVAGLVGTGVGLVRAERELARANEITEFLKDMLSSLQPGSIPEASAGAMRGILDQAQTDLDQGVFSDPVTAAELRVVFSRTYAALGDNVAALDLARRAHEVLVRELGEDHAKSVEAQVAMASVAWDEGRIDENVAALEAVLARLPESHGEGHELVADVAAQLGNSYSLQHRHEQAAEQLARALEIYASVLTPEHPKVLSARNVQVFVELQWAGAEGDEERLARGEARLEALYEETLEALGRDHPQSLNVSSQLADWYRARERFAESAELLEVLLPDQRRVNGDSHPETIRAIVRLAVAHEKLGRAEESLASLEGALDVALELYPRGSIDLIYHYDTLERCYLQLGRERKADAAAAEYRAQIIGWGSLSEAAAEIPFRAARTLLNDPNEAHRDPAAALPLAHRAVVLSERSDPKMLRLLGLALLRNGERASAVATLQEALERVPEHEDELRSSIESELEVLRAGE